ncbi:hypothetical protein [Streptomyces sp. NPDC056663]
MLDQGVGLLACSRRGPERAMHRMLKEANSLGLTIRFEPIP